MTSAIIGSGSFKSSYFNAIILKCTEVHNFNNGTFPTITLHQSDQPDSLLFSTSQKHGHLTFIQNLKNIYCIIFFLMH